MFNHTPPQMRKEDAKDLVCILMIAKHTILRIKYRDNQDRLPTVKLFTISIALEIVFMCLVSTSCVLAACMLHA